MRTQADAVAPPSGAALRAMLDCSSQLLLACDRQGSIRWWNRAAEQALAGPRAEGSLMVNGDDPASTSLPNRPVVAITTLLHPDDVTALAPALAGLSGVGKDEAAEPVAVRTRWADGSWRLVEWTARVDDVRGLVFLAGRDLTEWQAADEALRAGEARLRAIVEHSPSPIFVQDLQGRYLLANGVWAGLFGCSPEDMVGATDSEIAASHAELSAADVGLLHRVRAECIADGAAVTGDVNLHLVEGPRELILTEFLLRHDDGAAWAVGGIATDITERTQVADALAERERLLDTVLEASPDIISLLDRQGRVHRISAAEQRVLGHRHVQPGDGELFPLVHPDDFDQVASAFIRMVTGSTRRAHVRYRAKNADGKWVTMDSRSQAVVDDTGSFAGAVVVSRDVSGRLQPEQRLMALRQAAEEASRAKSDFLSRMSHELRTPLNSILGFAQLLEMDELPMPQADAVDHILRGGRHLLDLIDEVLDIARIETGHLELSIRPVLVQDVTGDAVDLLKPAAERADVVVRTATDPDDRSAVLADRQRLLQVLLNLVSNAVKYNRPGGRVDVSWAAAPGGRVRLTVADTGRGIRAEDLGRVFEPFDRLGAEQSGVEGTGVGLALSRNLVEKMGGTVTVESVIDVGSTFAVDLPAAVVPDSGSRDIDEWGGHGDGRGAFRVLLVEPDLGSLELVERVLARRPGVVVLGAMHGRMALELAREHQPDLILLDLRLPDMPGADLLDRLGEHDRTAGIPVAVLSTEESPHVVRRLLGRGVAGHVAKPIDVRALLSLVDAVRSASGR